MKNFLKSVLFFFWVWRRKKQGGVLQSPGSPKFFQTSRRYRCYPIDAKILMDMLTHGAMIGVTKGVLPGSKLLGVQVDIQNNTVMIFVEHPIYPRVDGGNIPQDTVEMTDLREHFEKEIKREQGE